MMTTQIQPRDYVRRIKGRTTEIGRRGIVVDIHGTIAGDTLISVIWENDRTPRTCYTRQVEKIVR